MRKFPSFDRHPASVALSSVPPAAWLRPPEANPESEELVDPSPIFERDTKKEQLAAVRTVCRRLRAARELCGMRTEVAAAALGLSNKNVLLRHEAEVDKTIIPIWLILRAAKVYEVSIDYLFGITDEWETGVHRGVQGWMLDQWQTLRLRDLAALANTQNKIEAAFSTVPDLVNSVKAIADAVVRVRALNPDFDDLKAGARLLGCAAEGAAAAGRAEAALRRFKIDQESTKSQGVAA